MGDFGSTLPVSPEKDMTTWQAGTEVEVAWGMRYNRACDGPPLLLLMVTCADDDLKGWLGALCVYRRWRRISVPSLQRGRAAN
eukprot:COSAG01_NODE_12862_length_1673_cov_1.682338_2_plen_83_part_00